MAVSSGSTGAPSLFKGVFLVAAAYDIVLGLVFTFFYGPILDALDVTPPDNKSYIHLATVFILVQGLSYLFIYRDLAGNLDMIRVGILYKAAYVGVAVYYLAIDEVLHWVFFLFGMLDMAFMGLFIAALIAATKASDATSGDRALR